MNKKLVLTGQKGNDDKIIMALELKENLNKVLIAVYPENAINEENDAFLRKKWSKLDNLELPEGFEMIERELTIADSILPDDIRTSETDRVNRAQAEWQFIVLSTKLKSSLEEEINDLKENVEKLETYSSEVWNDLKNFWGKVQGQINEKNIFPEHSKELRENSNALFDKMKALRKEADKEFDKISSEGKKFFLEKIKEVEDKIETGARLSGLFDDLKSLQSKFKDTKFTKSDRSAVWGIIDAAFKKVKEKKFGSSNAKQGSGTNSPLDRINRRYDGLINAISKMENSIGRDRKDLEFETRRFKNTDGQLEAQIRQAKIGIIEQRISSKQEKLDEMQRTKLELEKKQTNLAKKAAEDKIKAEKAQAKAEAAQKIKQSIQEKQEGLSNDSKQKIENAVEKIKGTSKTKSKESNQTIDDIAAIVGIVS